MAQDHLPGPVAVGLVARHFGVDPGGLVVRRFGTGKFNTTYAVEGGPVPLVLRVAPTDDRSRMLFYEHRMMRQEPALHALLRDAPACLCPPSWPTSSATPRSTGTTC